MATKTQIPRNLQISNLTGKAQTAWTQLCGLGQRYNDAVQNFAQIMAASGGTGATAGGQITSGARSTRGRKSGTRGRTRRTQQQQEGATV